MLKDYLKEKGISLYSLAQKSGIAYSTLNDLYNGKVGIDKCRVAVLRSLAEALDMSMDSVYEICAEEHRHIRNSYNAEADLMVRAKYYYARLKYNGEPVDIRLCKVTEDTTFYIDDIARWRVESYIRDRRMKEFR